MRIKHSAGATAIAHEGAIYTPDEDGFIDVPFAVGQSFLQFPDWTAAEPTVYVPEPEAEPDEDEDKKPAEEQEQEQPKELTPAEKGALTKAANAAKAAAEAKTKTKK